MKSFARPSFWRLYGNLDKQVKIAARRAFHQFDIDPGHSSLHFKKLMGHPNLWSVRINQQYRAIAERTGDTVIWIWVGSHNDFDQMFG